MKIPGFATEETRQGQSGKRLNLPPGYAGRMAAVKEAGKKR